MGCKGFESCKRVNHHSNENTNFNMQYVCSYVCISIVCDVTLVWLIFVCAVFPVEDLKSRRLYRQQAGQGRALVLHDVRRATEPSRATQIRDRGSCAARRVTGLPSAGASTVSADTANSFAGDVQLPCYQQLTLAPY